MKLAGKTALVTGGSRGLGLAIAQAFKKEGANVYPISRYSAPNLAEWRGKSFSFDIANELLVSNFIFDFIRSNGRIDILVNNAGTHGFIGSLEDADWKQWRRAIKTNLYGPALMMRKVIPLMKEQGSGKIISVSGGGATKPMPGLSAYAASKAALVRLTETVALELKDYEIDVNAVAPGVLPTRMLDEQIAAGSDKIGREYYDELFVLKHSDRLSFDMATKLCVWLASSESDGVTGRLISAQWDDWENQADRLAHDPDMWMLRRQEYEP